MTMTYMSGALLGTTALASVLAIVVPAQTGAFHFHDDHVLGTSLDITAVGKDELAAALAVGAIRAEIARLDKVLSGWRNDSELHALNPIVRCMLRRICLVLLPIAKSGAGRPVAPTVRVLACC